jgi:hypothetical protein
LGELSGDRSEQLIEQLAQRIGRWRLTLPAILFLEVIRPLSFLASQGLLLCQPLVEFIYREPQVTEYAGLMADRANVDRLVALLERDRSVCGEERD